MPLVTSAQFQQPSTSGGISRGLQTLQRFNQLGQQNLAISRDEQIRQALSGQQMQPQTPQQQQLAAQSFGLGGEQAQAEQPQPMNQEQMKAAAMKIDPFTAKKHFEAMGIDSASKREEASRFAAKLQSLPFNQRDPLIQERAQTLQSEGRDPKDTLSLSNLPEDQQNQALTGVQLLDLSTKERFSVQAQQARGRQATQKSFAPITIINPKTGEKKLVSPTVDNLTGKGTLSPFDIPIGFEIASETEQEERSADLAAKIKEEQEKAHIKKTTSQDIKFMEKLGTEGANIYSSLQKAAQDASRFIPRLNGLKKLSQEVRTGTGANIAMIAKRTLGIEGASNMEVLNAKLGELAQDILNQQTGTKTDFDFQNAVRQSASLGKTKEANAMLIDALIARQQEAVDFGNQAKKAFKESGVKGVLDMRFEPTTTKNVADMTTEELQAELARMKGQQ